MLNIIRLVSLLVFLIFFTACAMDNYIVITGGGGSQEHMADDLKACKREAFHSYFEGRSQNGAVVGAVLGGAIGGALGGALDAKNATNEMKTSDIDPAIEQCMRKRGYEGTSRN